MTKNVYDSPIDPTAVTAVQRRGVAHVDDMIHAIDFDAPEGTPILAALDGTVLDVKDDSNIGGVDRSFEEQGNYIEILHENGEVSEYEHLQYKSARVTIGDAVQTGQQIAAVGNTGWSEQPHLHFMVYPQGQENKTLGIRFSQDV